MLYPHSIRLKPSPLADTFNLNISLAWCLILSFYKLAQKTTHLIRNFDRLVTEASSRYPKAWLVMAMAMALSDLQKENLDVNNEGEELESWWRTTAKSIL
ncbi:hypothetical protein VNO77_08987 [Canavalia gladiata]|uniref:Uncharacterized protein n=1 Tax=Canavalia gladiata TaxID=3824 RepID=A0AAN9MED1_CANGL